MGSVLDLHQKFEYNKDTGCLVHKCTTHLGRVAGHYDPDGYILLYIKGKNYKAHRIVWQMHYGFIPRRIHHINGNKHDNRLENLQAKK